MHSTWKFFIVVALGLPTTGNAKDIDWSIPTTIKAPFPQHRPIRDWCTKNLRDGGRAELLSPSDYILLPTHEDLLSKKNDAIGNTVIRRFRGKKYESLVAQIRSCGDLTPTFEEAAKILSSRPRSSRDRRQVVNLINRAQRQRLDIRRAIKKQNALNFPKLREVCMHQAWKPKTEAVPTQTHKLRSRIVDTKGACEKLAKHLPGTLVSTGTTRQVQNEYLKEAKQRAKELQYFLDVIDSHNDCISVGTKISKARKLSPKDKAFNKEEMTHLATKACSTQSYSNRSSRKTGYPTLRDKVKQRNAKMTKFEDAKILKSESKDGVYFDSGSLSHSFCRCSDTLRKAQKKGSLSNLFLRPGPVYEAWWSIYSELNRQQEILDRHKQKKDAKKAADKAERSRCNNVCNNLPRTRVVCVRKDSRGYTRTDRKSQRKGLPWTHRLSFHPSNTTKMNEYRVKTKKTQGCMCYQERRSPEYWRDRFTGSEVCTPIK